jgi:hypothetical protein
VTGVLLAVISFLGSRSIQIACRRMHTKMPGHELISISITGLAEMKRKQSPKMVDVLTNSAYNAAD